MVALFILLAAVALQIAADVLQIEVTEYYLTTIGLNDYGTDYSGPSYSELYYPIIAQIVIKFLEILVLIVLLFVPSAGPVSETGQGQPETRYVPENDRFA